MVTRDEVAKAAGTSSAVVSYVMNGGPRPVAEATRQRVLAAVAELGYRPNAVARALRTSTTAAIGLVLPDITNPFFSELALAVERAGAKRGFVLFLGNAMQDDEQQAGYLRAFFEYQVRGILVLGAASGPNGGFPQATKQLLDSARIPVVFLDRIPRTVRGLVISADNADGGYQATSHLLGHGYGEVARFTGPVHLSSVRERNVGWRRALDEHGLDPERQLSLDCPFDRFSAYERAAELFAAGAIPRAMFVHSDEQAIGVTAAAAAQGVRIPDDLALAAFDGIRSSALTSPPLTTVRQPLQELATRAVEVMAGGRLPAADEAICETFPVELVVRRSCGCT